jgi:hypothetical protein
LSTSSTCQEVGALERLGNVVEPAGGLGIDFPDHLEVGLRIDRSVLGREVPNMAEGGQNLVGGPQIFVDCLRFRRRLDNDDIHVIPMAYGENKGRFREIRVGRFASNMGVVEPPVKWTDVDGATDSPNFLSKKL